MNKQQLASKIWQSANKMRSKIEANEYKDYILGFIFYKFLSDKEIKYLTENDYEQEDIEALTEEDVDAVTDIQTSIGYFIAYENLFSTWLEMGSDFDVDNVRTALSAFTRLISDSHKKVFDKIFDTLQTGLSKLGDSSRSQTKAVSDLIHLIKDIPMDAKQDYDVLGFIYEYLISNFAANAGKKAGEFYTPHEVSFLMSEIVADHLKDRDKIEIYDPTSGSGSLLINIGKSVTKYLDNDNAIKYYAQELKENTYNLTRMNLVMRGIIPSNIYARNGDTLEEDWPFFDEMDPIGTYEPLYVDAVVSNPPYSQSWNPSGKEMDARYAGYGLAPKGKADYAFLLHDLYHLKPDGIMNIVLPHGVLFRGGEEGEIRKNLIENNNIDAIIGLPANIFFGTGIPTIIMVLRQKRERDDVLIIDASKGFIKEGKNNKLRASDIKKIVDAVKDRNNIEKFCRVVSRDEIRNNDYNLNIPRYVDSTEKSETWDIYASMFGGIPARELEDFEEYWSAFPSLKGELFTQTGSSYYVLATDDVKKSITENGDVQGFKRAYQNAFFGFDDYLKKELIDNAHSVNVARAETTISDEIFSRLNEIPLIDKYEAYQLLNDEWNSVATDIEIIQTEGFDATKLVDPNIVTKKKDGKDVEVQEGWVGHVVPFDIAKELFLPIKLSEVNRKEERLAEILSEYEEIIDILSEDDKEKLLNDDNDAFVGKEVENALRVILSDVSTRETETLEEYMLLTKKQEKLDFISAHTEIKWDDMTPNKDGTFGKCVAKYIMQLKSKHPFDEGTYEYAVATANTLINEEKELKKNIKTLLADFENDTKKRIENMTDEEVVRVLEEKWIKPISGGLSIIPNSIISVLFSKLDALAKKYETTFSDVEKDIRETEKSLKIQLSDLEGSEEDLLGLDEFKRLLGGN